MKLVLQRNRFLVESPYPAVLRTLLADETIRRARVAAAPSGGFAVAPAMRDRAVAALASVEDIDLAGPAADDEGPEGGGGPGGDEGGGGAGAALQAQQPAYQQDPTEVDPDQELHSFEIDPAQVVGRRPTGQQLASRPSRRPGPLSQLRVGAMCLWALRS